MEFYPKGVKWKLKIYTAPQKEFFQKYFVVHERWAVKNSSSTYRVYIPKRPLERFWEFFSTFS